MLPLWYAVAELQSPGHIPAAHSIMVSSQALGLLCYSSRPPCRFVASLPLSAHVFFCALSVAPVLTMELCLLSHGLYRLPTAQ